MGRVFESDKNVKKVLRVGVFDENREKENLIGVAQVLHKKSKRGEFLHIPMGPNLKDKKDLSVLVEFLKDYSKQEKISFIKINPFWVRDDETEKIFTDLGFKNSAIHVSAEKTLVLDLNKTEEEILSQMRKTTRNLIRRAEKEGVKVISGVSQKLINDFFCLNEKTVKRQKFTPFSNEFIKSEISEFFKKDSVLLINAYYNKEPLSSGIFIFYGKEAFYHHGASLHSKIPASYLMMFEAIKEAKKRGMQRFNFWGIVGEDERNHPWFGLSNFKRGFGGKEIDLIHCKDLPIGFAGYTVSFLIDLIRKKIRRY